MDNTHTLPAEAGISVIGTHNGLFHADDILGAEALKLLLREIGGLLEQQGDSFCNRKLRQMHARKGGIRVVRTRDQKVLDLADVVIDVGARFDTETEFGPIWLDHHQGGLEPRPEGTPYAAFGLVWRLFMGEALLLNDGGRFVRAMEKVERDLVIWVDAADNGCAIGGAKTGQHYAGPGISAILAGFNPGWKDKAGPKDLDRAFERAGLVAIQVLENFLRKALDDEEARQKVQEALEATAPSRIMYLSGYVPFSEHLPELDVEGRILYVVFPEVSGEKWMVQAAPEAPRSFKTRKPFPASWAGLRDKELAAVTGVPDAVFCHKGLFIAGAETLEGAIRLAELALES
jgi:uncharacterized UPF0160 family protein